MIIAMDIDDVVARFTRPMLRNAVIYDKQNSKLKRGIINPDAYWVTRGMFDWSEDECKEYEEKSTKIIYKNQRVVSGVKQFINLMRQDGHKIYFITARGLDGYSKKRDTQVWLKEQNIKYDKLFFKVKDKVKILKKYNVDIYIEDSYDKCVKADAAGIFTIQFCDFPTRYKNAKFKRQINSWHEIYELILKLTNLKPLIERYPIIIDTDVCNEIDDEFALAYIFSFINTKIEAVTIAPHFQLNANFKDVDIEENVNNSYKKAVQIAKLTQPKLIDKIYKGDVVFSNFGNKQISDAVKQIINICKNNDKVIFISLGANTNLAHALELEPKIANKIKLYALMGQLVPNAIEQEFNMSQDFKSTQIVLKKIRDKHIFPITGFSNLIFSKQDISNYLKNKKNDVLKLLLKDFNKVTKEKFANCKYKSMYDFIIPFYLTHPTYFIETNHTIKLNNVHVLFKFSKNKTFVVSNVNPNYPIKDFYNQMKIFNK